MLLAAAGFALAFDTFIPQHTGIARIASYLSLLCGLAVGLGAQGALNAFGRKTGRAPSPLAVAASVTLIAAWAVPSAISALGDRLKVPSEGEAALAELRERREGGGSVLSNVSTRGVIEFATGLEAPIEGRQPVIEDREFLGAANLRLADAEAFFRSAGTSAAGDSPDATLAALGVRWVLAAELPEALGSNFSFGEPRTVHQQLLSQPGLVLRWRDQGLALFERKRATDAPRLGPARDLDVRWAVSLGVLALGGMALALGFASRRPGAASGR